MKHSDKPKLSLFNKNIAFNVISNMMRDLTYTLVSEF